MKLLYILGNIINRAGVERIMTQKINYLAETNCDVSLLTKIFFTRMEITSAKQQSKLVCTSKTY